MAFTLKRLWKGPTVPLTGLRLEVLGQSVTHDEWFLLLCSNFFSQMLFFNISNEGMIPYFHIPEKESCFFF